MRLGNWVRVGIGTTLVCCAGLAACSSTEMMGGMGASKASDPKAQAAQKDTLYMRLGGEPAITAVVDDFVPRTASNPKVNFTRKGTGAEFNASPENVAHLKKKLVELMCQVTGGPQKYTGRDMKALHANMAITNAEFDAMAADLKASLDKLNVPGKERDELMTVVGGTRKDVVTR